jgi:hypothetical protein
MKTTHLSLTAAVWAAMSLLPALEAQEVMQTNDSQTDQATQPPPSPGAGGWKRLMANLTESERQQLKSAHDKATQQNPALEEAMKTAHQSMEKARKEMHDAMIAIDPAVASILAKIEPPKWGGQGKGQRGGPGKGGDGYGGQRHAPPPGMANLTEQERTQLKSAHEQIKNDPSVVAAHEAVKSATTPEARHAAHETLRQAADAALLKVDSTLGPILEKLHQAGPPSASSSASSNSTKDETMAPAQ